MTEHSRPSVTDEEAASIARFEAEYYPEGFPDISSMEELEAIMTTQPSSKVILDSQACSMPTARIITTETTLHRFVLAELNTHRSFSRNSASSRAIPVQKQLERVLNDPAVPLSWPKEQKGMQGGDELDSKLAGVSEIVWLTSRDRAVDGAKLLVEQGVHKSVVNRLLEPFMWHTVIITATYPAYEAFFDLRCSPMAQPEIRVAAEAIRAAVLSSTPQHLRPGEWHLPYVTGYDYDQIIRWAVDNIKGINPTSINNVLKQVSTARCARVSYLTHDGRRDLTKDLELAERLANPGEGSPPHASPFEHVATPTETPPIMLDRVTYGNLAPYWRQYRHELFRH
jgi:thymidylate synthase ThyX